jgi:hypothetical protein
MTERRRDRQNQRMNKQISMAVLGMVALTVAHPFDTVSVGFAQDAAAKAATVLADARKALGGEEKLRSVRTLHAAGDVRRSIGDMQMDGELELMIEPPGRMRREETMATPGGGSMVRTEVLNGTDTWDDNSQRGGMGGHMNLVFRGPGGREMSEEELKAMRLRMRRADLSRYLLAWLLVADAPVSHAGTAEAPDGSADVLEVKPAEGPAMRLFVDRTTRLPLMLTWKGPQPRMIMRRAAGPPPPNPDQTRREDDPAGPPAEATFEMRFDDYRAVDGIQLPHHISRGVAGSVNEEWTIKRFKVNEAFKNSTFTR